MKQAGVRRYRSRFFFRKGYARMMALLLLSSTNVLLQAETPQSLAEIQEELKGPVTVVSSNHHQQQGRIIFWDETTLRLEVSSGAGIAEISYSRDEIQDLIFPGETHKSVLFEWIQQPDRLEEAMQLFRSYYAQRAAYLSLLGQPQLYFFVHYAKFALKQNKPLRAVAVIETLQPHVSDPFVLRDLNESLLIAFFKSGMKDETRILAREWVKEATAAGSSALGWRILAELYYKDEDFEMAFWTAIHPVAFSNQMPMAYLEACYAFAILSAKELKLKEEADILTQEMINRGLEWPTDIGILRDKQPEHRTIIHPISEEQPEAPETTPETPDPPDFVEGLPTRIYN